MEQLIFIYAKGKEIKVLNSEESARLHAVLPIEGWVHTQTLNPCVFIQYLHNNCDDFDLIEEIKSLSNKL